MKATVRHGFTPQSSTTVPDNDSAGQEVEASLVSHMLVGT